MLVFVMCLDISIVSAKSLSEIRSEIKEKQAELEAGKSKESSLAAQVNELEKKIYQLESEVSKNEENLKALEAELAEAEAKVDTQNDNLGGRLRNMYKNGSVGFLDVLLDSNSFSEFLTNLGLVEKVYASDKDVLEGLEAAYNDIDTKKKEVETLKAELEKSKTVAQEEKATVEKQKAEIAASNNETEKMIDDLAADAQAISSTITNNGSSSDSSDYGGGIMAWPTPSCRIITSDYGYRIHPISGVYSGHTGIDIGASYGSAVVAANAGTVIYSGWYGGYGNCVIVDHGGGISTLYGHNSSLLVSYGQRVSRGQTIARVGSTGNSTGPHCHFEVRVNSNPVNPWNYL
ncbi:MAG: peptidoglycan DD-metalloendopeptidase family protein [Clostridiales bacterium]|nr:peptidoglycan DD-metalloendopeptidase family protein [Clostridiales bacterium]